MSDLLDRLTDHLTAALELVDQLSPPHPPPLPPGPITTPTRIAPLPPPSTTFIETAIEAGRREHVSGILIELTSGRYDASLQIGRQASRILVRGAGEAVLLRPIVWTIYADRLHEAHLEGNVDQSFFGLTVRPEHGAALLNLRGERIRIDNCVLEGETYAIWSGWRSPLKELEVLETRLESRTGTEAAVRIYNIQRATFRDCVLHQLHDLPNGYRKQTLRLYGAEDVVFDRCVFRGGRVTVGEQSNPCSGVHFRGCRFEHEGQGWPVDSSSTTGLTLEDCHFTTHRADDQVMRVDDDGSVRDLLFVNGTVNGRPILMAQHVRGPYA